MQVDQHVILEPHVGENWEVFPILSNRVCIGFARDCPETTGDAVKSFEPLAADQSLGAL
jgi:hypothetical protein